MESIDVSPDFPTHLPLYTGTPPERCVLTHVNEMKVEIHPFSRIPAAIFSEWERWVAERPEIQRPFCHPGFSKAVDLVFQNVEVAVAYRAGSPVGVLPFQRISRRVTVPAGSYLSNFSGWITEPGTNLNPSLLIEATNVRSYRFHALPAESVDASRFGAAPRTVVYADVSGGFGEYTERKKSLGSNVVAKLAQKERKISREVGPLRVEVGFTDEGFEKLLLWKRQACSKRSVKNILDSPGYSQILVNLTQVKSPDFRHHFVRLMAGDQMVAVHMGMICHQHMAAWLPAFNPDFAQYSPGLLLLLQLLKHAESWNVARIDFGNGEFFFKDRFKTGESMVLEGMVGTSRLDALAYNCWLKSRDYVKSTGLQPVIQRLWNVFS